MQAENERLRRELKNQSDITIANLTETIKAEQVCGCSALRVVPLHCDIDIVPVALFLFRRHFHSMG